MLRAFQAGSSRLVWLVGALLSLVWLGIYISTASPTVNFIDSGELITSAYTLGIAHPPGYPLYVLMGYVASHLLGGEVAWRVNLLSAFWGAAAVGVLFLLLYEVTRYLRWIPPRQSAARPGHNGGKGKRRRAKDATPAPSANNPRPAVSSPPLETVSRLFVAVAVAGASLLGASATFWSRTAQAKMYSLHYFFVALLFLIALELRWAYERSEAKQAKRWLVAVALALGISLTNHLMTNLLIPGLLVLVLYGRDWKMRLHTILSSWRVALPALLLPLLLYLYLPLRASQNPLMDWGSPDTWGDFWRHVGGWQYRVYLFGGVGDSLNALWRYASSQWAWFSALIMLGSIFSGSLLAKLKPALFVATLLTILITLFFTVAYGISEIEPYIVPFYMMLMLWLVAAPVYFFVRQKSEAPLHTRRLAAAIALAVVAIIVVLQYPRQNLSNDYLAEQYAMNVYNSLEPNSILLTNYWDFYAPTYYLQDVKKVRPDLAIVDISLVKYPWYTEQLTQMYPWLIEKSKDIVATFRAEQLKWVSGQPYDAQLLAKSYADLLTSFVQRNYADRPAYILCPPGVPLDQCEANSAAPAFQRQPIGLVYRLWQGTQGTATAQQPPLPTEPKYDLRGITSDYVPLDDFAGLNATAYYYAYNQLAQLYASANKADAAQRMQSQADAVKRALQGRLSSPDYLK